MEQVYLPENFIIEYFACVIHETVEQLLILKVIHNWPSVDIKNFKYKTPEERFNETEPQDEELEQTFLENCGFFVALYENLLDELVKNRSFDNFSRNIDILTKMETDNQNVLIKFAENQMLVEGLKEALKLEKEDFVSQIWNVMENIGRIKDQIEDFQIESEIKIKYIHFWQNSKLEMILAKFADIYRKISENLEKTKTKIDREIFAHENFEKALIEFQGELNEKVEMWKRKYEDTLKKMNEKIKALQEERDKELEKVANLTSLYEKRKKEIHEWDQYKIEQEKIKQEKLRRAKAATKIQAWWRGTMVRKGFGKYRKKKDKKQKKSSEKSSSKK